MFSKSDCHLPEPDMPSDERVSIREWREKRHSEKNEHSSVGRTINDQSKVVLSHLCTDSTLLPVRWHGHPGRSRIHGIDKSMDLFVFKHNTIFYPKSCHQCRCRDGQLFCDDVCRPIISQSNPKMRVLLSLRR